MTDPTAEQILTALNDGEPVDYTTLEWCVITGGFAQDIVGGRVVETAEVRYWPFEQGELLILNDYGREPFGEGRKPGKWSVAEFSTRDYEQALALSQLVKANPGERGLWKWADGTWRRCTGPVPRVREANQAWLGKELSHEEARDWTQ